MLAIGMLYLIEILHQTTTSSRARTLLLCCILSKFYIKPQPSLLPHQPHRRCILSKFYIKPQQERHTPVRFWVVSYRNSTSNHNVEPLINTDDIVVSYRNSTSNHNWTAVMLAIGMLYLIEILHQTTTSSRARTLLLCCILSKFYIKPQPSLLPHQPHRRCILSKFYIKPQLLVYQYVKDPSCILSKFYIKPQR